MYYIYRLFRFLSYLLVILINTNYILNANNIAIATGVAFNSKTHVTINNYNNDDINFVSRPLTHPLKPSFYYDIRANYVINNSNFAIGAELIHHKLYFEHNLPSNVDKFEATDGYNLIFINLRYNLNAYYQHSTFNNTFFILGFGAVLPHMDVIIDGKRSFHKNHYPVEGFGMQLALQKKFQVYQQHYMFVESKIITSQVNDAKIDPGTTSFNNTSIHLLLGYSFGL